MLARLYKETRFMKCFGLVSISVLFLVLSFLFGTTALIYAQDQGDAAKPAQQETRPDAKQDQPSSRQGEAKPAEQSEDKPARDESKPGKQENAKPSKQSGEVRQSRHNAQHSAAHQWGRIPDDN